MFKISLDAGHGGYGVTPGKRAPDGSMYEWDFNNGVVCKIKDLLAQYKDVAVLRVDDPTGKTDVPLGTRTNRINDWNSDVHVSVHGNAAGDDWSPAHGIETFAYSTSGVSYDLAKKVQAQLVNKTGLTNRGVKTADFWMIKKTKCPAILTENGFMSNKEELALMKSDAYHQKIAEATVNGLAEQFKLVKAAATISGWKLESGKWYFYKNGTILKNDWAQDSKKLWYYLGKDGAMVTSDWVRWKNKWYYMLPDGQMATDKITVKGSEYQIRPDGTLIMTDPNGAIKE